MRSLPQKTSRTCHAGLVAVAVLVAGALSAQPPTSPLQGRWGLTFEPHDTPMIWGSCSTDYNAILDLTVSKTGELTGTADLCAWPGPATVADGSVQGDTARFHLIGKNHCTCGDLDHPEFEVTARLDGTEMHVTMVTSSDKIIPFSGRRLQE